MLLIQPLFRFLLDLGFSPLEELLHLLFLTGAVSRSGDGLVNAVLDFLALLSVSRIVQVLETSEALLNVGLECETLVSFLLVIVFASSVDGFANFSLSRPSDVRLESALTQFFLHILLLGLL